MTEIKKCVCDHPYQDKKYGHKKRVANKTTNSYRCTVCGKEIVTSDQNRR